MILGQKHKVMPFLSFDRPFVKACPEAASLAIEGLRRGLRMPHGKLDPDDGPYPPLPGRPIETNHPIEPIVIGDGQAVHALFFSSMEEIFRVRSPIQQRVVGVTVEFNVIIHRRPNRRCAGDTSCLGGLDR